MLLGCIADDFTGASDLANTLTRAGMRTVQSIGVPAAGARIDADAVVVALKTRSIEPRQAVAQSLAAYAWLARAGCRQFLFKICSTFDSTPRGNIGPVGAALRLAVHAPEAGACVPVCPAFPATGRTVYRGHLFVGDRLLSESGMEKHPLTPMTDANLVRVLQAQTRERVGLVTLDVVRRGPGPIAAALKALGADGCGFAIVDAIDEADLRALGAALADAPLAIGGSGIALGLPENFRRAGRLGEHAPFAMKVDGPCALLAGSCSGATRAQVDAYRASGPVLEVELARAVGDGDYAREVAAFCVAQYAAPLVASSAEPERVAQARSRFGEDIAMRIERFFGALAAELARRGVRRFVVAGGETSGAVVGALALVQLHIGAEIDPGVPALFAQRDGAWYALALKSGNFGARDFFAKAQRFV
ncbi:MAG: four-carbon acid sugar kinase family protein [Burkholderiaceae bacterium]